MTDPKLEDLADQQDIPQGDRPAEIPASKEPTSTKEPASKKAQAKPAGGRPSFWQKAARWLLGLLIIFGLGVLATIWVLYLPLRQSTSVSAKELESARQEIVALNEKIDSLSGGIDTKNKAFVTLEEQNKAASQELNQANLHINLLSARSDVLAAQLALADKNLTGARAVLSKTSQTLKAVSAQMEPDEQKVITGLEDRLKLALSEIDKNSYAARSDLDVIANSLLELENSYFAQP